MKTYCCILKNFEAPISGSRCVKYIDIIAKTGNEAIRFLQNNYKDYDILSINQTAAEIVKVAYGTIEPLCPPPEVLDKLDETG